MIRSSESNIGAFLHCQRTKCHLLSLDSVAASLLQMQEVHSGYKDSLDASGKQRVREVRLLNGCIRNLVDTALRH
jgi:hypothetical protein